MNKLQKLGVFVFTNYLYYNVIGMSKIASKHKKKKVLLYSAILSLMLSGNNSAMAEDLPILVSSGSELKSAIEKASNSAKIQFEKDIDISSLNTIQIGAKKIEIDGIDGNKNSLINEKDSRFIFSNGSNLTLKNMKYTGKNSSINVNNANTTISLENVDISGRTTSAVPNGPVLSLIEGCDATLNNVSVSSSRVNIQNNSINGGAINIQTAKSKGTITDLINNQITSAGNVSGGLIYNRRTTNPVGELNLGGDVKGNKITAKVNVSGGILNNESSSIQSINWNEVTGNTITTNNSVTGGFIQNKLGMIDKLHINSFSGNEISSNLKIDGGLIYNESGTVNNTLEIKQIVGNTIKAQTDINGLITNVTGTMNSISIDSVSGNNFEMNFLRGGVINLQGASVNDITIGEINNNIITGKGNSTSTGFVLYLRESPNDSTKSSNIGNLTVGQINENTITATNITSLLLRSALVPVENATVISKNGNVTVDKISNNTLTAVDCNDNARGGIIYNFLHGGIKTTNTTVSLGDINLEHVYNNRLESTISTSTSDETKALSGRHASGTIIANSIQSCQGNAIIKSINGEYIGNSLVSKSKVMDASGGVISNSVNGQGNAFVGIGYTLDENNKIVSVKDAILGTYKNNSVQSTELSANGGVIANYVESSKENDIAQIGNIKAYFEGNYVLSKNDSAYGGAIANFYVKSQNDYKNAIIDSINSIFENNCAKTESADASKGAYGGAISNTATIKAINNSTFKNNYAISNNGSNALGGAIYTTQDLVINANDNKLTEFTGNYVSTDGGATKNYEAINVDASGKTLTLNATTGGTILLNDYINGVNGYNVVLTGDDTGTIKLYNNADIKGGANVTVGGSVVIDTADGVIQNFSKFNSLKSDASAKYNIDLDLSKANSGQSNYTIGDKIADGFTTQTSSGGTITIDNLNIIDNSFDKILDKNLKIQIIQNNDNTDSLQLALSDKLTSTAGKITQIVSTKNNPLTPTANYKDLFGEITTTKDIHGTLGLGKTNTTNDSLNITVTKVDTTTVATISDALVALTNTELKDSDGNILDKTFNLFDEDSLGNKTPANYKVSNSLGSIYKNLNIVGATKTGSLRELILSELDLDGKTSFVVNSGSTLNISDIKLTGNETVITNNNGNLNFTNNNTIDGKITGTTATNTGVLGINANNLDVALTNNGTLNLGEGNVKKEITGSGSTNILDAVTNNAVISQNVNVNGSGKLTVNANIGNLLNNGEVISNTSNLTGTINNSGILNLSGTLDKNISGNGTTKVNETLNLSQSATIDGTLDLNNGTISTSDSSYSKYNITTINGKGNVTIDVDWANSKADSFNSTSGNGVLNLKLNETSTENIWDTKTIQITNGGVGISLDTKTGVKEKEVLGSDDLKANTNWSDKVGFWKRTDTYSEKTSAIKSNGSLVNNTIQYEVTKTNEGTKTYTTDGDTLALIVQNTVAGSKDKTFTTTNANDIYTAKENLGILADNLTISGATDGTNTSTIILGDKQGITISGANSLTIKDVKITSDGSIINATSNDAKITLDNANLQGDVLNQGDLSVKNSTSALKITGTGKTNIDTSGKLSVSELIQNELTNAGNLTVNNLKISTSANNSGTITNNGLISEIKNLTNSGTINGVGNLEISGTSNNSGNISQSIIKVSGTLDNTLGTLTATDKIENIGSITTAADKIIATNGIINENSLTLTSGNLSTQISGTGTTNIAGTVTNNSTISQNVNVDSTGKLTVKANIGNLLNNGEVISSTSNLTGTINNSGTLNLSGALDKTISGNGTTKVNGTLNLSQSATIDGTLDLNNGTISTSDSSYSKYNITTINGKGNVTIDVDWANSKADSFNSTSGNGVLNLKLNETSTENIWDTKTIQITNGGVGISLDTKTGVKEKEVLGSDDLKANTNWSDKVGFWKRTDTYSEKTSAIKSNGSLVNNTIQYEVTKTNEGTKTYTTDGDTLALIVQNTVAGSKDKTFTTTNANDIYTAKENLGILADNLTISGATDGTNTSTIILGDKQGITISGANSLTIKDVKITSDGSIINATSNDAKITLDNANLQGDVLNQGDLSVKNSTSALKITGTGKTNIDTSGKLSVSELIQNELTNAGNLTVNNLKISTSANNSGTITNNGLISEIKNLTNSGTINGVGNLEISGTSNNSGNISQSIIKVSGTLDNTLGTLTATDKIENIGSITTAADKIIATNGIINENSLTLTSGNLSTQISGTGTTNIAGTVTNNSTISQNVNVDSTGKLTVKANIGNLLNNGEVTSSTSNLTGTINNSGILNLSGTLDKTISGLGTTKIVGDSFTMLDGAVVKGVLDINNQTLNVLATNTTNMFNDVNINSGTLNLINNGINNLSANSFKISGNVNLLLDADLKNSVMDRLPSTTVVNGLINVKGINLLSDSTSEKTYIPFAYDSFKDKVQTNITTVGKDVNNEYQTTAFAPIYKYDVSYNPNNGNFLFSRGGGKSSADFNPAVLSGAVNSQVGAYSAVNETFNYAFRHADYSFMPLPKRIRTLANKYAITEPRSIRYENDYSKAGGIWYQPYANFENVGLSNGPRVDIQSYGSLIGGDSSYKQLKRGWGTVTTPYIGYNGTSQSYSGVSTTTNGGILGLTQTFYHGDFFTALTINAGASNGESSTMYGKENYTALMAGIGSKTGYNFEFNDGKFIIQPSMLMAYSYVNTFDYTNAAGVKISSDPLHSIQLHPSIKFMGNVGKGWQPYASVGMVWNILNETNFTANNVRLPEMSIRPYVEYGVGLQKIWHDKCTGFVQAMLRNGGRNGIALTFGFKWAVGNENKPIEKVQNDDTKHVLKSSALPTQKLERTPQSIAVQSPIIPIQKVNNLPKNVIQTSNNTVSLNSRLNILTPQQLAQRANFNITTSTPKTIKTSQLLK